MQQYSSVDREAIWAALFAYFQTALAGQFVTMGRRHIMPPDLVQAMQPAFFLIQVKEGHGPKPRGVPTRLTLHGFIILYVPSPVVDEVPGSETMLAATTLNGFFKAIDTALQPDTVNGVFTLGGRVSHCWIEGDTDMDPGIYSQQAAAILNIHILVP